jgi:SNF2 family DNA or RNA helicase
MASRNQPNGTSPHFTYGDSSLWPTMGGLGSPEPRPIPTTPLHTGTNASYNSAHMNGFGIGRPPSNVPLKSNGARAFSSQPKWNPAALLNPRGFHSGPQQNVQNGFSNNNPAPQLSFQFDSPATTPGPSFHAHPPPQRSNEHIRQNGMNGNGFAAYATGNGNMGGMGHMLERMHNVTERDMVPQKRRKIEDQSNDAQRKAEFNGGGKGGVLGNYMREKKEEGQREARANGTVPVVTALDDDDEVEIVPDAGDKEVCYGRIEGAEISAFKVPTPKPGATAISNGYLPQVKIVLRRRVGERTNTIHAVDSTREIIGCVDVNTSIGLTPLLDSKFGIRTAARILTRPKRDGDPPPGAEISKRYGLDLNIYGPKKYALQIGRHLSQKQLWLRTPLFVEAGVELHNPHAIQRPPQPPSRSTGTSYGYRQQGPVRTTEEIRNDVLSMFDSLERSENLQEMDADPRITTELLRHQKQGLFFMINKEKERDFTKVDKSNCSLWQPRILANGQRSFFNVITGQEERVSPPQVLGGILADMMGLGKTLSILSLVVQTLDNDAQEWAQQSPGICENERDLCPTKKGKAALPKIEATHLVQNCKTTLLVSPLSTIANWEEQIKQHIKPGTIKYYIYHGANRVKDIKKLAEYDLVITTYGSVASEFNYRSKKKHGTYPLEEINWFRIVLDEAHMIREQSTQQSKAICRLAANRRWAVTGTPVQNRLEDLGALMTFLRIRPFDEKGGFAQHIMAPFKMCDPEILPKLRLLVDSITLRRLKDRIDLPPRRDQLVRLDFSSEERTIYEIFAKNASDRVKVIVGQREKSLGGKSYVHILQSILRLRLICAHGRDLLGEEDLKVMEGLSKDSAIDLDSDEEEDRPGLTCKQAYDMYNLMKETNADLCLTCGRKIGPNDVVDSDGEPKDEIIGHITPCYHIICTTCIDRYKTQMEEIARGQTEISCPICQQHIKLSYFPLRQGGVEDEEDSRKISKDNAKHGKDLGNYSGPHTKTKALINDLLINQQESELMPNEPPIKSVVFSGWTAHLDLIQLALSENGIKYTRLDGKMSRTARGAALDAFRDDSSIIVILVSITAGGLGLNLTTANKVYVMEPQYNPAAEAQAVDRVHRLGQKREVETVRYIMKDSFEEKMLELQDKKKKLASLSMDNEGRSRMDKTEAARKRLEDLRSLFK